MKDRIVVIYFFLLLYLYIGVVVSYFLIYAFFPGRFEIDTFNVYYWDVLMGELGAWHAPFYSFLWRAIAFFSREYSVMFIFLVITYTTGCVLLLKFFLVNTFSKFLLFILFLLYPPIIKGIIVINIEALYISLLFLCVALFFVVKQVTEKKLKILLYVFIFFILLLIFAIKYDVLFAIIPLVYFNLKNLFDDFYLNKKYLVYILSILISLFILLGIIIPASMVSYKTQPIVQIFYHDIAVISMKMNKNYFPKFVYLEENIDEKEYLEYIKYSFYKMKYVFIDNLIWAEGLGEDRKYELVKRGLTSSEMHYLIKKWLLLIIRYPDIYINYHFNMWKEMIFTPNRLNLDIDDHILPTSEISNKEKYIIKNNFLKRAYNNIFNLNFLQVLDYQILYIILSFVCFLFSFYKRNSIRNVFYYNLAQQLSLSSILYSGQRIFILTCPFYRYGLFIVPTAILSVILMTTALSTIRPGINVKN